LRLTYPILNEAYKKIKYDKKPFYILIFLRPPHIGQRKAIANMGSHVV